MKTVVAATDELWNELTATLVGTECTRVDTASDFKSFAKEDVFFDLTSQSKKIMCAPGEAILFINSPLITLKEIDNPPNVFRINCWSGFLQRDKWEIAGLVNQKLTDYFSSINKQCIISPDVPGFISPRILSMIINEAYFTLEEGVSTTDEIDVAMKLGTNYPKGPFEWSMTIGLKNILALLNKLSEEDVRYTPSPLLKKQSCEDGLDIKH